MAGLTIEKATAANVKITNNVIFEADVHYKLILMIIPEKNTETNSYKFGYQLKGVTSAKWYEKIYYENFVGPEGKKVFYTTIACCSILLLLIICCCGVCISNM